MSLALKKLVAKELQNHGLSGRVDSSAAAALVQFLQLQQQHYEASQADESLREVLRICQSDACLADRITPQHVHGAVGQHNKQKALATASLLLSAAGETLTPGSSGAHDQAAQLAAASLPVDPVEVISAFDTPLMTYDGVQRKLRVVEGGGTHGPRSAQRRLLGTAESKHRLLLDRLQLVQQRLQRSRFFRPLATGAAAAAVQGAGARKRHRKEHESAVGGSGDAADDMFEPGIVLTDIQALNGESGAAGRGRPSTRYVAGALTRREDGRFCLEADGASVPLDLSRATTTSGLYTESCVVIAKGRMAADGAFHASVLGMPPLEAREEVPLGVQRLNYWGGADVNAEAAAALAEKAAGPFLDDRVVILADVWLDRSDVIDHLHTVFKGFSSVEQVPTLFILMGNFSYKAACRHAAATGSAAAAAGLARLGADADASQPLYNGTQASQVGGWRSGGEGGSAVAADAEAPPMGCWGGWGVVRAATEEEEEEEDEEEDETAVGGRGGDDLDGEMPYLSPEMMRWKRLFDTLADVIDLYPRLKKDSRFVLCPGPADPAPGAALPRPPLPRCLTSKLRRVLAKQDSAVSSATPEAAALAAALSGGSGLPGDVASIEALDKASTSWMSSGSSNFARSNVVFTSNPFRLRYLDRHVVFFREDVTAKLKDAAVLMPPDPLVSPQSLWANVALTQLHQSHLCPLPPRQQPVFWDFDAALNLYPLPHAVVIADASFAAAAATAAASGALAKRLAEAAGDGASENVAPGAPEGQAEARLSDCCVFCPGMLPRGCFAAYVPCCDAVEMSQLPRDGDEEDEADDLGLDLGMDGTAPLEDGSNPDGNEDMGLDHRESSLETRDHDDGDNVQLRKVRRSDPAAMVDSGFHHASPGESVGERDDAGAEVEDLEVEEEEDLLDGLPVDEEVEEEEIEEQEEVTEKALEEEGPEDSQEEEQAGAYGGEGGDEDTVVKGYDGEEEREGDDEEEEEDEFVEGSGRFEEDEDEGL